MANIDRSAIAFWQYLRRDWSKFGSVDSLRTGCGASQSRVKLWQPLTFAIPSPRFKSPATAKGAFWLGKRHQSRAPEANSDVQYDLLRSPEAAALRQLDLIEAQSSFSQDAQSLKAIISKSFSE
jgi:hypothetical protein